MSRPIGIDLFAGAGGLSLGFEQAGFDVKAAIEIDPVHCAVHKFNFPKTAVICSSVADLNGKDIRAAAGIGNREVDCVFGGAPCQGFSLIGHRVMDDPRNQLVADFVRLVVELNAKTFVFENVKGLTIGQHRTLLNELIEAFSKAGYEVRIPWKVLNSAHYGVPQFRDRLFLLGARKSETLPDYPAPLTTPADGRKQIDGLPTGPTTIEAIGDIPDASKFKSLNSSDEVQTKSFGKPSFYAAELRCLTNDSWYYGYMREWNPNILTSSARTAHTEISRRRYAETKPGEVEPISRFFRLPGNGLSNTLRAGTDGARGAFTSPRPIHYKYPRCVTVREMARLHGFPDWFRFNVTKWHGARQIGNAVPPPLCRAVAGAVLSALGKKAKSLGETLVLGDPKLLTFDLTQASNYFGVERPSSKRDRKSGAKKRKQIDIERERTTAEQAVAYG